MLFRRRTQLQRRAARSSAAEDTRRGERRPVSGPPDPAEFDEASIPLLELRHRMKNLIAVVQAVANQTLRSGRSIDEARRAFDGRLAAMGDAVDMLLGSGWTAG